MSTNQYHSDIVNAYRRRLNTDKGLVNIKKAVYESNRMAEFRNREKLKQEMARQRRLQMESDRRLKFNMQRIREQERSIAKSYSHLKYQTVSKYGRTDKSLSLGDASKKKQDELRHHSVVKNDKTKAAASLQQPKETYLPSLKVSKPATKHSNTNVSQNPSYHGQTGFHAPKRESIDINLRFTRSVVQEMQHTEPKINLSNNYYCNNPSVISNDHYGRLKKFKEKEDCHSNGISKATGQTYSHIEEHQHESLYKGDVYSYHNSVTKVTGQNFLVQASVEEPRWYQHIFVKETENGPMYYASNHYYLHPGGTDQMESVYLLNNDPFPNFNPDINYPTELSRYEEQHLAVNSLDGPSYHTQGNECERMDLKDTYYSDDSSRKKYEMLVLNQDDKRAEQIRVQQYSSKNSCNTYDILSIEQWKSTTPVPNA